MSIGVIKKSLSNPSYLNALRAFLCMAPMLVAYLNHNTAWIVPFGQGGFFNSTMPVAKTPYGRIVFLFLMIVPGLGFYLIGGNSLASFWLSIVYALAVGFVCALLTGFRYLGMIAISGFMPIYTAGLNAGSPEKAASSFVAFSIVILYCSLISLLPFWKAHDTPPPKPIEEAERVIMGVKLSLGTAIALGISLIFHFGKLGWAPSAVSSVIRTDIVESKSQSWIRAGGVIIGAVIAGITLAIAPTFGAAMIIVLILAVINGMYAFTPLGRIPILYNAVILILYSQTGSTESKELVNTRIFYNLVGIFIALALVYYPLPYISQRIKIIYQRLADERSRSR